MGFRLPGVVAAKHIIWRSFSKTTSNVEDVPKGYLASYVGDDSKMNRFVIPVSYLNQPLFHELPSQAEEEFWFDHPMGGLTIPCREDAFIDVISHLNVSPWE